MKARLITFGEIEIQGERYDHDVVIDGGKIKKRKKGPSKQFRAASGGHTPLSLNEKIPWGGSQLIVGTGAYGRLPIMSEVRQEAERREVKLLAVPTEEACRLLEDLAVKDTYAVLHTTC